MTCEHRRLPDLAFLALAVAEYGINAVILLIDLRGERHTASGGNALSERTGAHIDARSTLHIGMTLEHCAHMTEHLQLLPVKIALERQNGVQTRATMTL